MDSVDRAGGGGLNGGTMPVTLAQICRYPVKGLDVQLLDRVALEPGRSLPGDRRFAIAHGASRFDPLEPAWQNKRQFLTLMTHARLAELDTQFDPATGALHIRRHGREVAHADITTPIGREVVNQFLNAFIGDEAPKPVRLVEAPGLALDDAGENQLSLINRASLADLERVVRRPVDPRRFRGNLLIDGAAPWAEMDWVGKTLRIGDTVRLKAVEPIGRCAATTVNPDTAERDMNIPKALMSGFGHDECGVYLEVHEGGEIAVGDPITPE
jgi:uncharacterized protein YcbX